MAKKRNVVQEIRRSIAFVSKLSVSGEGDYLLKSLLGCQLVETLPPGRVSTTRRLAVSRTRLISGGG